MSLPDASSPLGSARELLSVCTSGSIFLGFKFWWIPLFDSPILSLYVFIYLFWLPPSLDLVKLVRELTGNIWDNLQGWGQLTCQGTVAQPGVDRGGGMSPSLVRCCFGYSSGEGCGTGAGSLVEEHSHGQPMTCQRSSCAPSDISHYSNTTRREGSGEPLEALPRGLPPEAQSKLEKAGEGIRRGQCWKSSTAKDGSVSSW